MSLYGEKWIHLKASLFKNADEIKTYLNDLLALRCTIECQTNLQEWSNFATQLTSFFYACSFSFQFCIGEIYFILDCKRKLQSNLTWESDCNEIICFIKSTFFSVKTFRINTCWKYIFDIE